MYKDKNIAVALSEQFETQTIILSFQDKGDGVFGDLLVKRIGQNVSVTATDEYKERVSIDENSSLLVAAPTLDDQNTFTCMVVAQFDISEYPVHVLIHSKCAVGQEGSCDNMEAQPL